MSLHYKYHVGQIVSTKSLDLESIGIVGNTASCEVLYPMIDSRYFVRVRETDGYAFIAEDKLLSTEPFSNPQTDAKSLRIVFFGNGKFAAPTLQHLIESGYNIIAVVTAPDYERNRRNHQTEVKQIAIRYGLNVLQLATIDSESFRQALTHLRIDLGIVVDYKYLPSEVIATASYGMLNMHCSLLPAYRGSSPVETAIRNGDSFSGVTVFRINDKIDEGAIVNNLGVPIEENDDAGTLTSALATVGAYVMEDAIQLVVQDSDSVEQSFVLNDFYPSVQQLKYTKKLTANDLSIHWNESVDDVCKILRSLRPKYNAHTRFYSFTNHPNAVLFIDDAKATNIPRGFYAIGELAIIDKRLCIACNDYFLEVTKLHRQSGRAVSAVDFINGYHGQTLRGVCN